MVANLQCILVQWIPQKKHRWELQLKALYATGSSCASSVQKLAARITCLQGLKLKTCWLQHTLQRKRPTLLAWFGLHSLPELPTNPFPDFIQQSNKKRIKVTINAKVYTRTASNESDLSDTSHAILLFHESTCLQHYLSPCVPLPWMQMESMTSSQSQRKCELWKCQNPSPEHHR